ncbi:hypothetical protein B0H17DRAFT_1144284 [Mycena rosella]|uniref:Uncharacterized protein n=1 Tax=Mycena rosella TaxID=1033263 RepID=A0AAD7CTT7_MYCRO|nr:hypothetical protein B0H17DRAFT_1144284 [Mycena rosella]
MVTNRQLINVDLHSITFFASSFMSSAFHPHGSPSWHPPRSALCPPAVTPLAAPPEYSTRAAELDAAQCREEVEPREQDGRAVHKDGCNAHQALRGRALLCRQHVLGGACEMEDERRGARVQRNAGEGGEEGGGTTGIGECDVGELGEGPDAVEQGREVGGVSDGDASEPGIREENEVGVSKEELGQHGGGNSRCLDVYTAKGGEEDVREDRHQVGVRERPGSI